MILEPVIGIEIHVELSTKSKMFSAGKVHFGDLPNTNINIYDLAYPGTMPRVNKMAIEYAIRACAATHCTIDNEIWFDRKNYFYADLPKGFQITQDKRPIGRNGYVEVNGENGKKKIYLERIHMEEDTAKQMHYDEFTLIDYNRCGTPLIEIVTTPCINSASEAVQYVENLRGIMLFLGISDAKMEEGSMRCDINISLKEKGSNILGTKVEMKNLNSLNNIKEAINFEIERQSRLIERGEKIIQETRRFNEEKRITETLRVKVDSVDYKYFTEPNILPIKLDDSYIERIVNSIPLMPHELKEKYITEFNLSEYDASLLITSKLVSDFFMETVKQTNSPKLSASWILNDLMSYLNKEGKDINQSNIDANRLAELIILINDGKISTKQAKEVFEIMKTSTDKPSDIASSKGMVQISDTSSIDTWVKEVLDENPSVIEQFKNGRTNVIGFLVGQVIKKSKGQANPGLVSKVLNEKIKEY